MIRLYHVLLGLILIPLGIGTALSYFSPDKNPQKHSNVQSAPKTKLVDSKSNQVNIWENLIQDTQLPPGWKINPCESSSFLLCVSANESLLGTIEMGIFPLKTQPNFQKMLLNAGIPPNADINYLSPKYLAQVNAALKAWAKNHYSVLARSRKYVYDDKSKTSQNKDGMVFSPYPLQTVKVGNLNGIRYGFAGLKQKGGVYEQHTGYITFDGEALYLIKTAFAPDMKTSSFEKLENLSVFQPYLNEVVAGLKLPS